MVFLAAWRRPEITELCFMGINRLRRAGVVELDAFAVISEESLIPLCERYNVGYTVYKNFPLGEKKNHGLAQALKLDWQYLIEIGSDDLLKTELLYLYRDTLTEQLYGLDNFIWLNSATGDCRTESSCGTFGTGRAIRRDVIETHCLGIQVRALETLIIPGRSMQAGEYGFLRPQQAERLAQAGRVEITGQETYKLWNDNINRGLDNNSTFFLAMAGVMEKKIHCPAPYVIDVKSKENIWPFNAQLGKPYPLEKALAGLSRDEIDLINELIAQGDATKV